MVIVIITIIITIYLLNLDKGDFLHLLHFMVNVVIIVIIIFIYLLNLDYHQVYYYLHYLHYLVILVIIINLCVLYFNPNHHLDGYHHL